MKEIIAQYGNVIIACIVGVAIIGLLSSGKLHGGQGIARVQGRLMEGATLDATEEGNSSYDKIYKESIARIVFCDGFPLMVGSRVCLNSCFSWENESENPGAFQVLALQEKDGTWCELEWDDRKQATYLFAHEGIYTCWLEKMQNHQIVCCDMIVRPNLSEG